MIGLAITSFFSSFVIISSNELRKWLEDAKQRKEEAAREQAANHTP